MCLWQHVMWNQRKLSRRDFLRLSAVTAAGAVLAACAPKGTPEATQRGETAEAKPPEAEAVTLKLRKAL